VFFVNFITFYLVNFNLKQRTFQKSDVLNSFKEGFGLVCSVQLHFEIVIYVSILEVQNNKNLYNMLALKFVLCFLLI